MVPTVPKGTWAGKIRLEAVDYKQKLIEKDGQLFLADATDSAPPVIYTVLDADTVRKDKSKPTLDRVGCLTQLTPCDTCP